MSEFILSSSNAIPKPNRPYIPRKRRYPFEQMEVGQNFFIPERTKNTLATHASLVGRQLNMKFTTRLCWMRETKKEGWVLCESTDKGAVQGIGVWRTA